MIGAGGQAGQGDAANLLKPALARGELRTIAATTWAEYKKYFEKDAALSAASRSSRSRSRPRTTAIVMMRGLRRRWRSTTRCASSTRRSTAAVKLSHRYISGRQLPDKAVSLLDTACARVGARASARRPPAVEDCAAPDRAPRASRSASSSARRPPAADARRARSRELEPSAPARPRRARRAGDALGEGEGRWSTQIRELRASSSRRRAGRARRTSRRAPTRRKAELDAAARADAAAGRGRR